MNTLPSPAAPGGHVPDPAHTVVRFLKSRRRMLFVAGDILAVVGAGFLAVALRFDFDWSAFRAPHYRIFELLVLDLILTPAIFSMTGLYQGYWKYAGLDDLVRLSRAVAYRTGALIILFYAVGYSGLSRAVIIIDTLLLLVLAGSLRLVPRFQLEFFATRRHNPGPRTIIFGAGDTGESLLREIKKGGPVAYNAIGFIDDDHDKAGLKIHGVPVLGTLQQLERLIQAYGVREVILAIPDASVDTKQEVFEVCRRTGARFKTVPTRGERQRGVARLGQIRPVDLEDLLGRDVVNLDEQTLRRGLSGRRVLVTGAAGSIGREMARQIAMYQPGTLIVLDRNENNLFHLEAELREAHPLLSLDVIVADVTDRARLTTLFREIRPEIVFHAAAYKHVPLMEQNPTEAIKNNVLATLHLAEIAGESGVERFIYVSTDKAVRPTSIMGATKRLGERLIKSASAGATRFIAVRFGNVLGSDGSVVPTFRRQIAAGGPVTVTHPEATRFFMTIPEAVQLVLLAGAMGEGNETFLLQMGQPVRIIDLARNMIELSGLRVDEDVKIVFTGLRPGEKLHEELSGEREQALPTTNQKIMVLTGVEALQEEGWALMRSLEKAILEGKEDESLALLRSLVPEYQGTLPGVRARLIANVVGWGARRRQDAQARPTP